jgi:hypothetical protein
MSNYYYGSTFGGQRQRLPSYYGSRAPYAPYAAASSVPPPPQPGATGSYFPTPQDMAQVGGGGYTVGGGQMFPQTAPAPAPTPAPARPAIDFANLDYSNDPILARTRALAEEAIAQANADARANRTRLAIGFGDPELADKLKLGGDVRKQAAENTFGTVQELERTLNRRNVFDINRPLSDTRNLFYSTERARELGLSGEQHLRDRSTAWNSVQDKLATISQQVQASKMAAQAQIIQAEQAAYARALQQAMYAAGV